MNIENSEYIGYITRTRGLKGELQIYFEFEDYQDIDWDFILVDIDKKLVPFFIDSIKLHNNKTGFIFLQDIDHVDKVTPLLRKKVYLPLDKIPKRDEDDFRWTDLIGYWVVDDKQGELGEIIEIQEMPQQHIATVDMEGKDLMFPLSEDLILGIDTEEEVIEVNLPEGLVDLYREQTKE